MSAIDDTRRVVSLQPESRRIAEVTRTRAGEAIEIRLDGHTRPVRAHLDTVTALENGDAVLVDATPDGVVVVGRLRHPGEPPAAPVRIDDAGRLLLARAEGVAIRAGGSTLELRPDGAIVLDGKTILATAEGLHRLQGATIELN